ncbi:MAG: ferritin family protein [Candidatus Thorarchaeota archaeon]
MLSKIPTKEENLSKEQTDSELLRAGILAELDAINLYEQMAATTDDDNLKKVFMEVAKEEKTHVGEFQAMLLEHDAEQVKELKEGKEEVEEITGK